MGRRGILILGVAVCTVTGASLWHARDVVCIDGVTIPWIDDTVYAPEYSHGAFCALRVGVSSEEVLQTLGRPLKIGWSYGAFGDLNAPAIIFTPAGGSWRVSRVHRSAPDDLIGQSMEQVRRVMQAPKVELWGYSDRGPSDGHYRVRVLHVADARVIEKVGGYYYD